MNIDPSQIQLSPDQQAFIAHQAEISGLSWATVLGQFIPAASRESVNGASAYEAAQRLGLIGGVQGEPADLATNPEHMNGIGE